MSKNKIFHVGNVGINETSPNSVLHVKHSNNNTADITIEGGGGGNAGLQMIPGGQTNSYFAYVDTNRNFRIQDHTAERLRIIAGGKVLIGNGTTYTPQGLLHIVGDDNSNGPELYLQVNNNNTTDNIGALIFGNNVDKSVVKIQGVTHTANNTGDITFHTSTTGSMTEKARITSAGALGVGVNPEANSLIHVKRSSGAKITIESDDNNDAWINYSGNSNEMSAGFDKSDSQFYICNSDNIQNNRRVSVHSNGTVYLLAGDLIMHSTGHIEVGNGGNASNPMFLNTSDPNTGIFFPGADRMAFTTGGTERLEFTAGAQVNIGTSGTLKAQINNSVNGHYFVSQCDDNNNGFEIYQQHGSTSSRNTLAVYNNSTGSKHLNFYVRGDNQVFISTNKDSVGLVMDGTSSGTAYGETGATIDFRMLNEVNQFTGDPAARIASYLERGNNGFGLKFFARTNASTLFAACQVTPDYEFEPCSDSVMNLGSDDRTWKRAYVRNAYPDHGTEQVITGSSFSNGSWHDTGFQRNSVGGLDTNGTYIVTGFADLYQAMGGNYSVTYTWIVGLRDQYTNQSLVNTCPLLSVCGHSTNNFGYSGATVGDGIRLGTSRQPNSQGGMEKIVWRPAVSTGEINNTSGGRILRFRIQRIGRTSTG